jgi:hypothetical protein
MPTAPAENEIPLHPPSRQGGSAQVLDWTLAGIIGGAGTWMFFRVLEAKVLELPPLSNEGILGLPFQHFPPGQPPLPPGMAFSAEVSAWAILVTCFATILGALAERLEKRRQVMLNVVSGAIVGLVQGLFASSLFATGSRGNLPAAVAGAFLGLHAGALVGAIGGLARPRQAMGEGHDLLHLLVLTLGGAAALLLAREWNDPTLVVIGCLMTGLVILGVSGSIRLVRRMGDLQEP